MPLYTSKLTAAQALMAKVWANRTFHQSLRINGLRAISLGIGFIGSIYASRCLGPDKLGISGMIIGTITPLVLILNLNQASHFVRVYRGYASDEEKANLVTVISTYKIATSFFMMLVAIPILIFAHFSPAWHLGLIAAFPFFLLTANAADWLLQCEDKVPVMSLALMVQSVITTTLYFLFFRPGMSAGADIVIQSIGIGTAFLLAWYHALNGRKILLFEWRKLPEIIPVIRGGRWLILIGLAVYIFTTLEVPLIGWLYSLKEVGIYRTSVVLTGGVSAFTGYIPMLLYARMIEWNQQGPAYLWHRQKKVLKYFAMFAFCLSALAFLLAPWGYHLIYGPAFQKGAYPFAILLTAKLMAVLSGILSWGMTAQKKERALFWIMIYVSIFSLASNLIFIPRFGAFGASTVNFLSEVLMFTLIVRHTRRSLQES